MITADQLNKAVEQMKNDPEFHKVCKEYGLAIVNYTVITLYHKIIDMLKEETDDNSRFSQSGQSVSEQAD